MKMIHSLGWNSYTYILIEYLLTHFEQIVMIPLNYALKLEG